MLFKNRKLYVLNFGLILALLGGLFGVVPVQAITYMVTNTNDNGPGSLRQAIADAVSGDAINFDSALAGQMITLASTLVIDKDLTIDGSSLSSNVKIDGGGNHRVFKVINTGNLTIKNLTVQHGNAADPCENNITCGGAIAMYNDGVLTVTNSTFKENTAQIGGAIFIRSGTADIANSTFIGNTAAYSGGGIVNWIGSLNVTNTTFYSNSATYSGGGIYNDVSFLTLRNSTFSHNSATDGGGVYNAGDLNFTNNILANSDSGDDCYNEDGAGDIVINTGNIVETNAASPNNCGIPSFSDDPKLDSLGNNGGLTQTIPLLPGSPAIDAGDDASCESIDQRGAIRPQGLHCDIGAFEYTNIQVNTAGINTDNHYIPAQSSARYGYMGVDSGPVQIRNLENANILSALRVIWKEPGYRSSYSEMMGLPAEQLSSEYWFPWYNNLDMASMDQGFRIGNVNATSTAIQVWVGTTLLDSFSLNPGASTRVGYNVDNGPIRIVCTDCTGSEKIIAALRVIWKEPGVRYSYSEMMGLPKEQLSSEYWFPWYNNAVTNSMDQGFRIVCTDCTNTNNDQILAALRVIWKEPGFRASYSEMMGLPAEALSTEYWFPWYNNAVPSAMDQGFRISVP